MNGIKNKLGYVLIGVAAVLLLDVVVAGVWLLGISGKSSVASDDPLLAQALEEEAAEKAQAEREAQIAAAAARARKADEEAARRKQAEEAERAQQDVDQKVQEAARAEAKRATEAAKKEAEEKRRKEEDIKNARSGNLAAGLEKLTITQVLRGRASRLKSFEISDRKRSEAEEPLLAKHAAIITNVDSVVVYYLENGTVQTVKCQYSAKHFQIRNSQAKTKYEAKGWPDENKLDKSPWVVYCVVNPNLYGKGGDANRSLDVFWWWNDIPKQQLFAEKDEVDLAQVCFGSAPAKALWEKHAGQSVYALRWSDNTWLQKEDRLELTSFCDEKALVQMGTDYDEKVDQIKRKMEEGGFRIKIIKTALRVISEYTENAGIKGGGYGSWSRERTLDEVVDALRKVDPRKYRDISKGRIAVVKQELMRESRRLDEEIKKLTAEIEHLEAEKDRRCSRGALERDVRSRTFQLRVLEQIPDGMNLGLNESKRKFQP